MDIPNQLHGDSIVAACDCGTKSPEIKYHQPGCKYRLIVDRDLWREEAELWRALCVKPECPDPDARATLSTELELRQAAEDNLRSLYYFVVEDVSVEEAGPLSGLAIEIRDEVIRLRQEQEKLEERRHTAESAADRLTALLLGCEARGDVSIWAEAAATALLWRDANLTREMTCEADMRAIEAWQATHPDQDLEWQLAFMSYKALSEDLSRRLARLRSYLRGLLRDRSDEPTPEWRHVNRLLNGFELHDKVTVALGSEAESK